MKECQTILGCTSFKLSRNKNLKKFLSAELRLYWSLSCLWGYPVDAYIGWGRKENANAALCISRRSGLPFYCVEDGFLRSIGRNSSLFSLIVDDEGIYYDATFPSKLETLISQSLLVDEQLQARSLINTWRRFRLSKYNAEGEYDGILDLPFVLVCDQTVGDSSIRYGLADETSFTRMLHAALIEYPDHLIILKTHPDVATRGQNGHFDLGELQAHDRIHFVKDPVHPVKLLEHAAAVYVVTSQLGFEALIWGKRVRCFGMPFYAGWGLTEDELPRPDRRQPTTLEQLVHAALSKYPRYIDPLTTQRCEPERVFAHVGLQRLKRLEFSQQVIALGFSRWKRPFIKSFLQGSDVSFEKRLGTNPLLQSDCAIAVWGSSEAPSAKVGKPLLRIEDGFLRSSGLGADFVRPLSLVIDDIGIYYDATQPSRLENSLNDLSLDEVKRDRAQQLLEKLIDLDVSKYNLGKDNWNRPKTQQQVLLVIGQVESDASIVFGSPDITTNAELLQVVRMENPSAYIVYKPHPDVLAGLRKRGVGEEKAYHLADEILRSPVSIGELLSQVDKVHTMTSLMGFEALIRGVEVVCHGIPFYAGWGLTQDRLTCMRRMRRLTLPELVYGTLISYPRYFNYERNCFIEAEDAIDQLANLAKAGTSTPRLYRKALRAAIVTWYKLKGMTR